MRPAGAPCPGTNGYGSASAARHRQPALPADAIPWAARASPAGLTARRQPSVHAPDQRIPGAPDGPFRQWPPNAASPAAPGKAPRGPPAVPVLG